MQIGQIDGEAALCFPEVVIAPGGTAEVSGVSDEYVLRLGDSEMVVAADGASDLRILGWRVGDQPWQSAFSSPVRALLFTVGRVRLGGGFTICSALPGTPVSLRVENTGQEPRTFRCGLLGRYLQRPR